MAPYYKKIYSLKKPSPEICDHLGLDWIDDNIQGDTGPLQSSFRGVIEDPFPKAWVETFKALGYPMSGDPFSGQGIGGFSNPATVDSSTVERSYSATAYYGPASVRSNLHVLTGSLVEKINLDDSAEPIVASSVRYSNKGQIRTVKARKEVILAAGAFHSPKLLELSGIGSAELLKAHGIPLIVDNPYVGENLQDHILTGISFEVEDGIPTGDDLLRQNPEAVQAAMMAYQTSKTGPFCNGGVSLFAFLPVADFKDNPDGSAELQQLLDQYPEETVISNHPSERMLYRHIRSILENPNEGSASFFTFGAQTNVGNSLEMKPLNEDPLPGSYVTLVTALLHPLSTGHVHINSPDPAQPPTIDPKYLSHPLDIEIFARHILYLNKIASTSPLSSLLKPNGRRNAPAAHNLSSLSSAKDYARIASSTNWHATGTCAMMPRDQGGVVDERLVVHGTRNLRVVDASVIPIIPQSNTQSTVYAVAERAADLIKEDHGLAASG